MKKLLLLIIMSLKLLNRGLLILCLTVGPLMANTSKAQVKSIDEVFITLDKKSYSLAQFFKETEKQSEFRFFYTDKALNKSQEINLTKHQGNVEEFLIEISLQSNLRFRQVNNAISVIMANKNTGQSLTRIDLAQENVDISGTVTDDEGESIPGVTVSVLGTTIGTATDLNGKYSLSVPVGSVLVFSFIGFETQQVQVGSQSVIDIKLSEDMASLDEVVVVGYGTQKKGNLTGSVVSVSGDELGRRQVGQTSMALQGLAPGVVVTQRGGQPGNDGGAISIRGLTTLNNNNVLVLVDGVEMALNNIDPAMIESISVLKDAASSAIYGSRAANGVILVTTKRGQEDKLTLSYNMYAGWQESTDLPKIVDVMDHMSLLNEAYVNAGSSPLYTPEFIEEYRTGMKINPDRYPNTDWYRSVLVGNGFMQNHTVSLSGGTEKARIFAALSHLDQNGIITNTNFKRSSLKINSDFEFSKAVSVQIDASIIQSKTKAPSRGTSQAIHDAGRIPANQSAVYSNGLWGEGWNGSNPVAYTNEGGFQTIDKPSVALNLVLKLQPFQWMGMDLAYSPNYWQSDGSVYSKSIQTYSWDGRPSFLSPQQSSLTVTNTRNFQNNLRYTLNIEKTLGDNYLKLLAGFQQEDYRRDDLEGYREVFTFDSYPFLNAGGQANQRSYGFAEEWAIQSFFGRANYDYRGRYLFEANYRFDGSSRFAKDNRWGGFPSVSAGWRISEENFFSSLRNHVDNLKIRASWGRLGNQNIGTYPSSSTVTLQQIYAFDGKSVDGAAITNMANREISWETTTVTNVGIDANLGERFSIVAEYFHKRTEDILLTLDVPKITGLAAPYQNAGTVENKGWDLGLNYSNRDNNFKYDLGFNISDVRNKVIDLKGISRTGTTVNREGYSMNSLFGLVGIGYITEEDYDSEGNYLHSTQFGNYTVGDIKYAELNGDNIINEKDYKVIGGTIPRFTFGMNFNAQYQGFDFSMLLQGVGKANGMIHSQGIMPFYTGGTVQEQHKDRWTPENLDASFPRLAFNETNNTRISTFWMKNAAYGRLKNLQVGYSLPMTLASKVHLLDVRIYLSGQNLLTIDDFWDGYDVEAPIGDGGYYPQQKTYSLGLDIKF